MDRQIIPTVTSQQTQKRACACARACVCTCVCMYVHVYVCACVCMCVCMCPCVRQALLEEQVSNQTSRPSLLSKVKRVTSAHFTHLVDEGSASLLVRMRACPREGAACRPGGGRLGVTATFGRSDHSMDRRQRSSFLLLC